MTSDRSDLEAAFARAVIPLGRRWRAAADRTLASFGLSHATGWVLIHIGRLGDAVPQSDLAAEADMQGSSLVRLIDLLDAEGLAFRRLDEADRRINRICLTENGRELVTRIENALRGIRREMLGDVSDDDLAAAVRVLQQVDRRILKGMETSA